MLQTPQPFRREDRDAYFDRIGQPCDEPDCAVCTWRNSIRKALGSLVEAVALTNAAAEAAHGFDSDCTDPVCTYERDMVLSLCAAGATAEVAADRLLVAARGWSRLPADWAGREQGYLAVEHRRRDALADAAEEKQARKTGVALRMEGGDGRVS